MSKIAELARERRTILALALVIAVLAVASGWVFDSLASWLFAAEEIDPWWLWTGLGLAAVCLGFSFLLSVNIRGGIDPTWPSSAVLIPFGLSWLGDGLQSGEQWQATVGFGASLIAWVLVVRRIVHPDNELTSRAQLAEHQVVEIERLAETDVLVASVGPMLDQPRTLLYTLLAMPHLSRIISIDDGVPDAARGGGQGVDKHLELLNRCRKEEREIDVRHVTMLSDAPPADFDRIVDEVREHLDGSDNVIVDVTGGRIPQSLATYDVARVLGHDALYVVANEPRELAQRWYGQELSECTRLVAERMARFSPADSAVINPQFALLNERPGSP